MQSEFDRVVLAHAKVAEAQAGYARACEAMAAGLIGEIAALPAERIGRAAAQMRIALADAVAGAGDVRTRQAWHALALRNGTPLPEDEDEDEVVLRLARAPSEADAAVLEGLGLKPARATVVGYRGRCGLAALAPLIERYDGSVQDGSAAALAPPPPRPRPRQPRQGEGPGEVEAKVPAKALSPAAAVSDATVVDAMVVPASIGAEAPGQVGRFVPRAPLPARAGERRSGGEGVMRPAHEPMSEPKPDGDDVDHHRGEGDLP